MNNIEILVNCHREEDGLINEFFFSNSSNECKLDSNSYFLSNYKKYSHLLSENISNIKEIVYETKELEGFLLNISMVYKVFLLDLSFYLLLIFQYSKILSDLEKKYMNDDMIEGFGLTNTILHLSLLPLYYGLGNIFAIIGSQAYSVKKYFLYNCIKNQTRLFGFIITSILAILLLKLFPLYSKIFDLNDEILNYSYEFLFFRIISFYFELEVYINILHLQMEENYLPGFIAVLSNFIVFSFFSNLFICNSKLDGITATGCTYIISNIFILTILSIFNYNQSNEMSVNSEDCEVNGKKKVISNLNQDKFINLFENINEIVKYIEFLFKSHQIYFSYVNMITLSFFDILSAELISLIAAYLSSQQYSSYILVSTIYGMISTINTAMAVCVNVILGNFIGKNIFKDVRKYFIIILLINNMIVITIGFITYCFGDIILSYISNSTELIENTKELVIFTVIINIQDSTFSVLLNTLKTLNMNKIALNCMMMYNLINFIIMYIFAFKLDLGVKGLYYGYIISDIVILAYLIYFFIYIINWEEEVNYSIKESEKNEGIILMLEHKMLNISN